MDELYRDQILEHYKRPHNFGRLDDFDLEFEDNNPFCGDEQHVFLKLGEDGKIAEISFEGQGCAISTAATSLLTDELEAADVVVTPRTVRTRMLDFDKKAENILAGEAAARDALAAIQARIAEVAALKLR